MSIKILAITTAALSLFASEAFAQANHNTSRSNKTKPVSNPEVEDDKKRPICDQLDTECEGAMDRAGRNPQGANEIRTGGEVTGAINISNGLYNTNTQSLETAKCYSDQKEVACPDDTDVKMDTRQRDRRVDRMTPLMVDPTKNFKTGGNPFDPANAMKECTHKELIGHECAHVVQQTASGAQAPSGTGQKSDIEKLNVTQEPEPVTGKTKD